MRKSLMAFLLVLIIPLVSSCGNNNKTSLTGAGEASELLRPGETVSLEDLIDDTDSFLTDETSEVSEIFSEPVSSEILSSEPVSSEPVAVSSSMPVSSSKASSPAKSSSPSSKAASPAPAPAATAEHRGVWIGFYEMDFSKTGVTKQKFIQVMELKIKQSKALGLNNLYVHARSHSDAFYKSSIFPWSALLTGTQGKDPGFDPFGEVVRIAHENGMKIHAWINPYRIMLTDGVPSEERINALADSNPGKKWYKSGETDKVVKTAKGLYYNPASKEVRALLIRGIQEIIDNYSVDGIHFDDYFYPAGTAAEFDAASFAAYNQNPQTFYGVDFGSAKYKKCIGGTALVGMDLRRFRYTNVNILLADVYETVKAKKSSLLFGVSPSGSIDYNLYDVYIDVTKICKTDGFIDYIMPQLYWGYEQMLGGTLAPYAFQNCLPAWQALNSNPNIKLYIGLSIGRAGSADAGQEWVKNSNIISRMVTDIRASKHASLGGFTLFDCESLFSSEERFVLERENLIKIMNK